MSSASSVKMEVESAQQDADDDEEEDELSYWGF